MTDYTAKARTDKAIVQMKKMVERLESAGPGYTTDVIVLHSVDDWMTQIAIKTTRARYSQSIDKMKDELTDIANYCALTLSLIDDAVTMPSSESGHVTTLIKGE